MSKKDAPCFVREVSSLIRNGLGRPDDQFNMKILALKHRQPILLDEKGFRALAMAIRAGKNQVVLGGNLVNIAGAQTYDTLDELEEVVAGQQGKRQCGFGNWHWRFESCGCPGNRLESPIAHFDIVDKIKLLPHKERNLLNG